MAPMPGALEMALLSSDNMASRSSSIVIKDNRLKAPLGPIPFTLISFRNKSSSSFDRNPYNDMESSFTLKYV